LFWWRGLLNGSGCWHGLLSRCASCLAALLATGAAILTTLTTTFAPLLTSLHPYRLGLSIFRRQHSHWQGKGGSYTQAKKRKSFSTGNHFRLPSFAHLKPPNPT
jgi:hypothetical protein